MLCCLSPSPGNRPSFFTLLSSSFVSVTALQRVCDSKIILHTQITAIAGKPKWLPVLEFLSFTRISVVDTHGKHALEQLCGWIWEEMHTMAWGYSWGDIGNIRTEERWILANTQLSDVLLQYNLFAAHTIQFGAMIVPEWWQFLCLKIVVRFVCWTKSTCFYWSLEDTFIWCMQ